MTIAKILRETVAKIQQNHKNESVVKNLAKDTLCLEDQQSYVEQGKQVICNKLLTRSPFQRVQYPLFAGIGAVLYSIAMSGAISGVAAGLSIALATPPALPFAGLFLSLVIMLGLSVSLVFGLGVTVRFINQFFADLNYGQSVIGKNPLTQQEKNAAIAFLYDEIHKNNPTLNETDLNKVIEQQFEPIPTKLENAELLIPAMVKVFQAKKYAIPAKAIRWMINNALPKEHAVTIPRCRIANSHNPLKNIQYLANQAEKIIVDETAKAIQNKNDGSVNWSELSSKIYDQLNSQLPHIFMHVKELTDRLQKQEAKPTESVLTPLVDSFNAMIPSQVLNLGESSSSIWIADFWKQAPTTPSHTDKKEIKS